MAHFAFLGGNLCLDFCNTMYWRLNADIKDHLEGYEDLVEWGVKSGVLTEAEAVDLRAQADIRPAEAEAVLASARAFREALFRVVQRHDGGEPPDPADLDCLSAGIAAAMAHTRLLPDGGGYATTWAGEPGALDRVLWPVAAAAMELLTSPEVSRTRVCEGPGCGWVFLDTTRNRSRRWCSMEACGNRDKVKRFYQRQKEKRQP